MQNYTPAPDLLKGRVILVTGAGDGIGRAAAQAYAAHGATVVLLGRTLKKLERVYDAIVAAGHPEPVLHPMNLLSQNGQEYYALADAIDEHFGRLDGVLHNAGWVGALTPVANYDIELWFNALQVNLNAPFLLTRVLLGLLAKSTDASVVFTADEVADQGRAYWGGYACAKGASQVLMKLLASELEANTAIRVNSVDPGVVRTNLRTRAYPGTDPSAWPEPETVLPTYLYLMGPDSRGLSGQTLKAQG